MDSLQTKAYGIFHSEILKQLVTLQGVFSSDNTVSVEQLEAAKIVLHRIKGGAGFFGLDRLGAAAGKFEELTKLTPDAIKPRMVECQAFLKEIAQLVAQMPAPQG